MVNKQWELIKQLVVPQQVKNGIIYCQRALRDFVVQHQYLASKINMLPMHQREIVKQYMLELEGEIIDIGLEQETMVQELTMMVREFRDHMQRKTKVHISTEIANGFVSRLLLTHNETVVYFQQLPARCTVRLTAKELAKKYSLENLLKLGKLDKDDGVSLSAWNAVPQRPQHCPESTVVPKDAKSSNSKPSVVPSNISLSSTSSSSSSSSSSSPILEASTASRSLLKPKQERLQQQQQQQQQQEQQQQLSKMPVREPRAFASVIESKDRPGEEEKPDCVKRQQQTEEETEEESGACVSTGEQSIDKPEEQATAPRMGIWMPGFRGRPPKGVNYIPQSKLAATQAHMQRASIMRKLRQEMMGVRQRGRPPKLPEKQESPSPPPSPLPEEEQDADARPDDSSEEQCSTASFEQPSAAVRRGRSNLQQALNRLRSSVSGRDEEESVDTQRSKATKGSRLAKHGSSRSSGSSSSSSRSSTPPTSAGRLAASDDSCDRRSADPLLFDTPPGLESEPALAQPNDIWELGMKALLNYYELCTPEEAKARRERRQERKRRSCYSTERKDFHYGRFDYYEQQQQQQQLQAVATASRAAKRTHKRPILYSPPVAVAKKRKHQQQQQSSSSIGTVRASTNGRQQHTAPSHNQQALPSICASLDSRDIFAAMSERCCFVCNSAGSTDELSACTNCCNIYHISCHLVEDEDDGFRHRDNLCPLCLTAEDGERE